MKKLFLFSFFIVLFYGCKDEDTTPPLITLNGSAEAEYSLGSDFEYLDVTATDETDGEVPVTLSHNVNKNKVGNYTITYRAVDKAGNMASATRSIKYNVSKLIGTYNMNNSTSTIVIAVDNVFDQLAFVRLLGNENDAEFFENVILSVDNNLFTLSQEYSYTTFRQGDEIVVSLISAGEILYEEVSGNWKITEMTFIIEELNRHTQQKEQKVVTINFTKL